MIELLLTALLAVLIGCLCVLMLASTVFVLVLGWKLWRATEDD